MSDTEVHKGKLIPMVLSGVTMEQRAKSACKKFGWKKKGYNSWEESLRDNGYKKIFIRDRVIYEVQDEELDPYGFSCVDINKDGSLDYVVMFYNGGGSFDEVLELAVNYKLDEPA